MSAAGVMAADRGGAHRVNWQTVIGWLVAALLAYGAVEARVRVLEDRYDRIVDDLREIKGDVKALRSYGVAPR